MAKPTQYTEENIRSLDWKEHPDATRNVYWQTG